MITPQMRSTVVTGSSGLSNRRSPIKDSAELTTSKSQCATPNMAVSFPNRFNILCEVIALMERKSWRSLACPRVLKFGHSNQK
jgi:hypothetical protein